MRLLISCLLVSATLAIPQHSFFTVQGHGSNAARIKAHLERTNIKENVPLSTSIATSQHDKRETVESTTVSTSAPETTTESQKTNDIPSETKTTSVLTRSKPEVTKRVQPQVKRTLTSFQTRKSQSEETKSVKPQVTRTPILVATGRSQSTERVQPQVIRTIPSEDQSQITGVLQPEEGDISNTLFSSVMIDILPEIKEFTDRLDNNAGSKPEEFVSAVSDLTNSFVKARAKDEGRDVTDEEENIVKLTEVAFDITLGLVKDMSESDGDITTTMKKMTDIVPRLASIAATARGRELSNYEIEDLKNANEMIEALSPFFSRISSFNFNAGGVRSGTSSVSNPNADFIQDYASQNLRNIQDFANSNAANFRDYNKLQSKDFSTKREQEYFRNNVRRVQEFARNNRKNVETVPTRLSPNGGNLGAISGQVDDIINDAQQFLVGEPIAVRQSNSGGFFKQFRHL